jgi:pimeloyl-ACP methyl ester carboxylesterase
VKTWYDDHAQGDPLVLLHGGLVDARYFQPNLPALAAHFHLYTPERRGHGHTPDVEGPITYQLMTDDTIAFLETVVGQLLDQRLSRPSPGLRASARPALWATACTCFRV